jgi:hypothetical protein
MTALPAAGCAASNWVPCLMHTRRRHIASAPSGASESKASAQATGSRLSVQEKHLVWQRLHLPAFLMGIEGNVIYANDAALAYVVGVARAARVRG